MSMQIKLEQVQGRVPITVMHLEGYLNLASADQLEQQARHAFAEGARYLLLDMGQVTSLTSAGLRAMLLIAKMLGANPAPDAKSPYLKLLNPNSQILNVLTIAGFTPFLDIFTNQAQAIAAF